MDNNFVVYLHKRKNDNSVFYVGAGSKQRPFLKSRSKEWARIVRESGLVVEIVKDGLTKKESFELEKQLILQYGRIDLNTGCLINCSEGGPGCSGISNKSREKKIESLKSVKKTEEWKRKISEGHKGIVKSEEWKRKIADSLRGKKLSEETRAKMRESNKSKEISSIPVVCYEYETNRKIKEFGSVRDASKELNCLESSISNNLSNRSKFVFSNKLKLKFTYHAGHRKKYSNPSG